MANAPYARPICPPSKPKVLPRYVAMLTYHAPQMKYWRNMKMLSLILSEVCMANGLAKLKVAAACFDEKNKMRELNRRTQWVCCFHCTLRPQPRWGCLFLPRS